MWQEFDKFLFSLLGAILGGSFVAWISGYYSEKGKQELLRREWPKLLNEAHEKARAEEAGKRLATKEDIDNVIEQVRAVTRETERIKAEVSSDVWRSQWLLNQKREVYATLIQKIDEKFDVLEQQEKLMATSMNALEFAAANEPLKAKLALIEQGFRSTVGLAIISLGEQATSAIKAYSEADIFPLDLNPQARWNALGDLKVAVVQAAKVEFANPVATSK